VDEERMRPGLWSGLVLCIPFSAFAMMVGWQEGHLSHKNPFPLIPRGSLLAQLEKDPRGNQLT